MIELRDHYDWVAVGQHPSALLAAALAARQGLSVLVLPGADDSGLLARSPTELLDAEIGFLPNRFFFERILKAVFGELPPWLSARKDDLPQVVTPDARFSIADARRWVPTQASNLLEKFDTESERFWHAGPSRGAADGKRTESSYVDLWSAASRDLGERLGRELKGAAESWAQGWGVACGVGRIDGSQGARLLGMAQSGFWVKGGLSRLRKELFRVIESAGGHISRGSECTQIFVERASITGVQVSDKGQTIGARAAVGGEPLKRLKAKTYFASGASFSKKLRESAPSNRDRFSVAISVHKEAIPPGLGSLTIWSEEGAPGLAIQQLRTEDYGLGESETRTLTLSIHRDEELRAKVSDGVLAARMIRKASDLIPFLDFHIVKTTSDSGQQPTPPMEGVGYQSGVERLYLATDECYPNLGTLGAFVAGVESVEHFLGRVIT